MSVNTEKSQDKVNGTPVDESKKELDFRKQEAFFKQALDEERKKRIEAEEKLKAKSKVRSDDDEDDDNDEPYIDKRSLQKTLKKFESQMEDKIEKKAQEKAREMVELDKKERYFKQNTDFDSVMNEESVKKFAENHPAVAEAILKMPDGFERQKLVYESIKALGMNKKQESKIQDQIDNNQRKNYYMPTGMGQAPYNAMAGDFSDVGKKAAFDKVKALKERLKAR